MVKHIVFWKLVDSHEGRSKAELAVEIKTRLEALAAEIPQIESIEVGADFNGSDVAADVALYSVFADREALGVYQTHPAHQAVAAFVREIAVGRQVVDYEV